MTETIDQPSLSDADRDAKITELSQLVTSFSDIGEKLRDSHTALTGKVERLQAEIAEKNRLLSDQQKQLERRNRLAALGEMAAGLAHEIRNPLGGIGLCADLLDDLIAETIEQHQSSDEPKEVVGQIRSGVQRLERTVSQVLRFAGETVAEVTACDVAAIVRETVGLARSQAKAGRVTLHLQSPPAMIGRVDPNLLGQAVLNLLLNAIDVASDVTVTLSEQEGRVVIVVTDDGPGLPEHTIDRAFDPFFTTKDTGTGLGLSIVHRIADAHGGRVSVSNRARPDRGACFELVL